MVDRAAPDPRERRGRTVAVSACLLGRACRHDGRDRLDPSLAARAPGATFVPVCPEELGGLGTPRPAAQMRGGEGTAVLDGRARVVDVHGRDVTDAFVDGARRAVEIARAAGATEAWLVERSPSCGTRGTYVDGDLVAGSGVASAAFARAGFSVSGIGDPRRRTGTTSP